MRSVVRPAVVSLLVLLGSLLYLNIFKLFDSSLTKQSMTLLDEARYIGGQYDLNDRRVPLIHPLYPAITACVHPAKASWENTARWVGIVAAALLVVLLWAWARQIDGEMAAWAAVVLFLTNVMVVKYATPVMAEIVGVLFFSTTMVCAWQIRYGRAWLWASLTGLAAGLFALARADGAGMLGYALLPVVAITWGATRNWRKVLAGAALFLLISWLTVLPYVLQLYTFNRGISLYKDIRYERIASVMLRVPDQVWKTVDQLPPGTVTSFEYAVGVRAIPGVVGKAVYTARKLLVLVSLLDRSQLASVFGVFVFLLVGLSLVPRHEGAEQRGKAVLYLVYFCFFTLGGSVLLFAAFDWSPNQDRRYIYLVPPMLVLAAIGTSRAAHLISAQAQHGTRILRWLTPAGALSIVLACNVAIAAPTLYWHARTVHENSAIMPPIRAAAAFLRSQCGDAHPIIAADDVHVPFHADGWYVPIHSVPKDSLMSDIASYGAEYVTVMGRGGVTWQGDLGYLLDRTAVPPGLDFLREFGDSSGFHVVMYRVVSQKRAAP